MIRDHERFPWALVCDYLMPSDLYRLRLSGSHHINQVIISLPFHQGLTTIGLKSRLKVLAIELSNLIRADTMLLDPPSPMRNPTFAQQPKTSIKFQNSHHDERILHFSKAENVIRQPKSPLFAHCESNNLLLGSNISFLIDFYAMHEKYRLSTSQYSTRHMASYDGFIFVLKNPNSRKSIDTNSSSQTSHSRTFSGSAGHHISSPQVATFVSKVQQFSQHVNHPIYLALFDFDFEPNEIIAIARETSLYSIHVFNLGSSINRSSSVEYQHKLVQIFSQVARNDRYHLSLGSHSNLYIFKQTLSDQMHQLLSTYFELPQKKFLTFFEELSSRSISSFGSQVLYGPPHPLKLVSISSGKEYPSWCLGFDPSKVFLRLGWNSLNASTRVRMVKKFITCFIFPNLMKHCYVFHRQSYTNLRTYSAYLYRRGRWGRPEFDSHPFQPPTFTIDHQSSDILVRYWTIHQTMTKYYFTLKKIRFKRDLTDLGGVMTENSSDEQFRVDRKWHLARFALYSCCCCFCCGKIKY